MLFGSDAVTQDHNMERLRPALLAVQKACTGRLWGVAFGTDGQTTLASLGSLRHNGLPSAAEKVPEMKQSVSTAELGEQYVILRLWLRTFKGLAFGHEFFKPDRIVLQRLSGSSGSGPCFEEAVQNIREASRWPPSYVPPVGAKVSSKRHGVCTIQQVVLKPDMQRFYSYVMSTPIAEIRCRGIWHIVVAWHYFVHVSTSSESLAESVGSILAFMRRSNVNAKLSTKRIVWATQIRTLGLRGMGGEEGILSMALNHHFKCDGPRGWHFSAHRKTKNNYGGGEGDRSAFGDDDSWQRVLRSVYLAQKPQWFGTPLCDLMAQRSIILSGRLPRPETFVVSLEEANEHRALGKTEQRKRKQELGDTMWEPKHLSEVLWKVLKISSASLPSHVRPRPSR